MGKKRGKPSLLFILIIFIMIILINIYMLDIFLLGNKILTGFAPLILDGQINISVTQSQKITVLSTEFDGDTTNFTSLGNAALETISSLVLEDSSYGKITFTPLINLTQDVTGTAYDRTVDLDGNISILSNNITINLGSITSFNKSATIAIYNTAFTTPIINRNGATCPASICTLVSNTGGTVTFTTTAFGGRDITYYSISEGASSSSTSSSSSSGGGDSSGGAEITPTPTTTGPDFGIDETLLEIELEKGNTFQKKLVVTNNGTADLVINVTVIGLGRFILPRVDSFSLSVGESKDVYLDIYAVEGERTDVYTGKIKFSSGGISRNVNVVFDLKDKSSLFDIETKVLRKYVVPGNNVIADIIITDLGDFGEITVNLEYSIVDFNNLTYNPQKETLVMDGSFSKRVFLETSKYDRIGDYVFYVKVTYGELGASSYDSFKLEKISLLMWFLIIFILAILIVLLVIMIRREKHRRKLRLVVHEKKFGLSMARE